MRNYLLSSCTTIAETPLFGNVVVLPAATLTLAAAPPGQRKAMRIDDQCANQRAVSIDLQRSRRRESGS